MFFLVRSAFCIGMVYCMLPDGGGSTSLQDLAANAGRMAVDRAGTFCAADAQCARAGLALAAAALAGQFVPADARERRRLPVAAADPASHPPKTRSQARS